MTDQRAFYGGVLGFEELGSGDDWVGFDGGDGTIFELCAISGDPQYDATRFQVGFAVQDIVRTQSELRELGTQALTGLEGGEEASGRWCYFKDPEGNVFELKEHAR